MVRLFPVQLALLFGRGIGLVVYALDRRHRQQVYLNLRTAFAKSKSSQEIRRVARQSFLNYAQNVLELLYLPKINREYLHEYVQLEGKEHVLNARKKGKGVILLAMHNGSWELANCAGSMLGAPYKVLANPQSKSRRLDKLLNEYRNSSGTVVLERGKETRDMVRSLLNNDIVAMVADQGGKQGCRLPFFGKEASFAVGAIRLALKMDIPVCFAYITRKKGPYHLLRIEPPFQFQQQEDIQDAVSRNLQMIVRCMEMRILDNPAEYMWFYKIWKYAQDATILILDDGRTGHLRQSQAVSEILKGELQADGIRATVAVALVQYRGPFARKLLLLLYLLLPVGLFDLRFRLLHGVLTKASARAVLSVKPDFIVSCGSATAAVNVLCSDEQQAKNVAILKPSIISLQRYRLVILPEHDRLPVYEGLKNVVFTKGAPNLITAQYLQTHAARLRKRFSHLKQGDNFKIGVLLGGDTKHLVLNAKKIKLLLYQLKELAGEINADILLTTSRRTSPQVENLVFRELKKCPRCKLLILANRNNVPEAVGGILGVSDMVLVSGDSISMLSEAASSGKKTVVFPAQHRVPIHSGKGKHQQFIDILNNRGYVLSTNIKMLKTSLYILMKNKIQLRPLDDRSVLKVALRKVI